VHKKTHDRYQPWVLVNFGLHATTPGGIILNYYYYTQDDGWDYNCTLKRGNRHCPGI